jgi:hypothetical protein
MGPLWQAKHAHTWLFSFSFPRSFFPHAETALALFTSQPLLLHVPAHVPLPLPLPAPGYGWPIVIDQDGVYRRVNGSVPPIVHQYDRAFEATKVGASSSPVPCMLAAFPGLWLLALVEWCAGLHCKCNLCCPLPLLAPSPPLS